jgi:hypothetical protein
MPPRTNLADPPFSSSSAIGTQPRAWEGPSDRIQLAAFSWRVPGLVVTKGQPRTSFLGGKGGSGDGENDDGVLG